MRWIVGIWCLLVVNAGGVVLAGTKVPFADGLNYSITLPKGVSNPPLILALHGGGGDGTWMEDVSGLTRKA